LEDNTEINYHTSEFYNAEAASGIRFDDPVLGIQWPLAATAVSEQDRNWPLMKP
jgi:dTDP-4-dehydrorhamnose 3,5-epimerase